MKNVLITGASRGIGEAIAKAFAQGEYRVFVNCRENKAKLEAVISYIREQGIDCDGFVGDVSDPDVCKEMFEKLRSTFGDADILINNAGISYVGLLTDMSIDDWNKVIGSNLTSIFNCCKEAIPAMVREKSGKIINISSVWGERGASCEVAYSASKGGVDAFTKALAKELAPSNVQVNAVACGFVQTDMNAHLSDDDLADIINEIPAGRVAAPSEIGKFVKTIAEMDNYLTGQILKIDGGWM